MESNKKWYQKPNAIVLTLVFFYPIGLFLMWRHATWKKQAKWIITGLFILLTFILMIPKSSTSQPKGITTEATQAPTKTAESVDDARPEFSEEEKEYHKELSEIMNSQSEYLEEIGTLQDNPLEIYSNEERMFALAVAVAGVRLNYEATNELSPPAKYSQFHSQFLASMKLFNDAMDDLTYGIDNIDADSIYEAADKMEEGRARLNDAMDTYPLN